jgi:2-polyprenyl-3-methyl-5-hydroxy-6-metoxy-1,4-benzoquinol methylase
MGLYLPILAEIGGEGVIKKAEKKLTTYSINWPLWTQCYILKKKMNKKSYKQMHEIESLHWWYVGRRLIITTQLKKIKFLSSSNILEVGSGTGGNFEMLSKFGKVYAFEKNTEALNITKSKNNHKKIRITQGSCPSNIPYSRIKFDLICLFDVLEHIADDKKTLINLK